MKQDKPRIAVVGSSNMDLVVKSPRIPAIGETILGEDFIMTPGGKGTNQTVAAAKLGAEVFFIARLGDDVFGTQSLDNLNKEGVNTKYVIQTKGVTSGVALITVDDAGNNVIVVAPGANQKLSPEDVKQAESSIASSGALVAQLEIPLETVEFAGRLDAASQRRERLHGLVPFPINKFNFLIRLRRSYFNRFLRFGTTKPCLRSE